MIKLISALVVLSSSAVAVAANSNAANGLSPVTGATTSATVSTVAPTKKKVTLSYLAEMSADAAKSNRGNTGDVVEAQQHVGVKYDLGNDRTVQYRQYFFYNSTDDSRTDEWAIGDSVIQATDATAYNIGTAPVLAYARMYFPVSESSRDVGKYELRLVNAVEQALPNKFTVEAALAVRGYAYTGDNAGQRAARVLPAVELSHQTTESVGLFVGAFTDNSWRYSGNGAAAHTSDGYTDLGVSAKIPGNISVKAYLETGVNLRSRTDYKAFNEDTSTYNLEVGVTL